MLGDKESRYGRLMYGDCLERMKELGDGSVDMVFCDLPYGTTGCTWDEVIPMEKLWSEYKRVVKKGGAVVLTAVQPFTTTLVNSNLKGYKTSWVWEKGRAGNFMLAKYHPLKITEDVLVFNPHGGGAVNYYPIYRKGKPRVIGRVGKGYAEKKLQGNSIYQGMKNDFIATKGDRAIDEYYPVNVIKVRGAKRVKGMHPTTKPVGLVEYLLRTYSLEGNVVLDNTAGSGTTAEACINLRRKYICIERDEHWYGEMCRRITEVERKPKKLLIK